jgi:hypothetical protein
MKLLILLILIVSCARAPLKNVQQKVPKTQEVSAAVAISHDYNRKEWKHWIDADQNCLDTRNEILKSRSLVEVQLNPKGCKVFSGEWDDFYYPEKLFLAKKIDIDHLIPLKNAHISGGSEWSSEEKKVFANDPENLVVTNLKYNRQKGALGIDGWLPIKKNYACKYIKKWVYIKNKYQLTILQDEIFTIDTIRSECNSLGIAL